MRRIGILGGTFNPIHMGHLMLAEWALDAAELDQVWVVPTGMSYKKDIRQIAPAEDRLRMTQLAVEGNTRFRCMDAEVRRQDRTYSYETLELFCGQYPEDEFFFILGADCLSDMETWKYPERIFRCCTVIAAVRDGASMDELEDKRQSLEHKFKGRIRLLPFLRMSLSSTEIRQRIRSRQSIRYLVPDNVLSYIEEKGLYREENR